MIHPRLLGLLCLKKNTIGPVTDPGFGRRGGGGGGPALIRPKMHNLGLRI